MTVRKLLNSLEKHRIRLDEAGEVDYSQCIDEQVVARMRPKELLVKEALLLRDTEFGSVHRQNRQMKILETEMALNDIAEEERALNEEIIKRLKGHIIQKDEPVNLSQIDQELGAYVHSLSAEPISKEDFYYHQSVLDKDNFLQGRPHQASTTASTSKSVWRILAKSDW